MWLLKALELHQHLPLADPEICIQSRKLGRECEGKILNQVVGREGRRERASEEGKRRERGL